MGPTQLVAKAQVGVLFRSAFTSPGAAAAPLDGETLESPEARDRGSGFRANPLTRVVTTYVRRRWAYFAFATAAALLKALGPIVGAWVVAQVVDELGRWYRHDTSAIEVEHALLRYGLIGIGVFLLSLPPTYLRDALPGRAVRKVSNDIRRDLYTHLHRMSQAFFDAHRSGTLAGRLMGDVAAIEPFIGRGFVQMPMGTAIMLGVLAYFFTLEPRLALVSMILLPVQLASMRAVARRTRQANRRLLALRGAQAGNLQERLAASSVVKAFTDEVREVDRFLRESEPILAIGMRLSRLTGLGQIISQSLVMLSPLSFVLAGGYLAMQPGSNLSVGVLLQFILMHGHMLQPLTWMIDMQTVMMAAAAGAERLYEILDQEPAVSDRPDPVTVPPKRWDIRFENASFAYPGVARQVLAGLDLHIPGRSRIALVGPSGGGKTTIAALLMRFYDVTGGRITIDGVDIRDYSTTVLRGAIGLVPQEPVLFSGTIYENILYGRPGATRREVIAAAMSAHAHDFISALDNGYDELVGERGTALSGGQRQRIAIARVFLKNPALLVLDEATSSLDPQSEAVVVRALHDLTQGRTTIVIAHRTSAIRNVDRVVVVDGGRVAEEGTQSELVAGRGRYARLNQVDAADEPTPGPEATVAPWPLAG